MLRVVLVVSCVTIGFLAGCRDEGPAGDDDGVEIDGDVADIDAGVDGALQPDAAGCGTPAQCGAAWEQRAADRLAAVVGSPAELDAFARAVPKGGDLHNHLSGAVYAETLLRWGMNDGDCINGTTFAAVTSGSCATAGNQPIPTSGTFFDQIVRTWSMLDFVPGTQTGHDHFFATFGKFGLITGGHRDDGIADLAARAAGENQVYLETMFNLGSNLGSLSAAQWSGTLTEADLQTLYDRVIMNGGFATALANDTAVVTNAATRWRTNLACSGASPPAACGVTVRFVAQIARTGSNDQIFGQLISAFEMAKTQPAIVGANLSSPEDDTSSLRNYDLHMAMLAFLRTKYTTPQTSPLHVTLHAGELTTTYLPAMYASHITFHIRRAVEIAQAERIGHGLAILSETDSAGLMTEMRDRNVLVEICLSSNDQILDVRGAAHPIDEYLAAGVPVALSTDDQGVSRSSMAGELVRAARDHQIDYRQLKTMARNSLEHAFVPGPSLWQSFATVQPVAPCAATDTMGVGDPASATCQAFLDTSERARLQWELERRFRAFESVQ